MEKKGYHRLIDMYDGSKKYIPSTITYHNISFAVPVKQGRKPSLKPILENLSGIMRPGINAILGPSGSGKTSLIRVLAGRTEKHWFSGDVFVNGERQSSNFRLSSGFVVQDDVLCCNLSVRENLHFSASLRLGGKHGKREQEARVTKIIEDLCLTHCADTRIGTDMIRGVSGGERKRTCIGMELITEPNILFLDEPTTGLDTTTALHIVELLRKQARQSKTIIFSIHQPRYPIFKLFDHVTLISQGKQVFAGPQDQMIGYFDNIGYRCEPHNNPADYVLDVIVADEIRRCAIGFEGTDLIQHFRNSSLFRDETREVQMVMANDELKNKHSMKKEDKLTVEYPASFVEQFLVLSKRLLVTNFRDSKGARVHYLTPLIIALFIGAIYYNIGFGVGAIRNRVCLFFLLLAFMVQLNGKYGFVLFIEQRRLFTHEYAIGYYKRSAFFLSSVLCDMIPMRIVPVFIYAIPIYFMAGCQPYADKFFIFVFSLIMTTVPGTAIAIWQGNSTRNASLAFVSLEFIYRIMFLFGGLVVRLPDIPAWLRWLQYFSVFKYGFENLIYNELHGLTFDQCDTYRNKSCEVSGDMYLESLGIDGGNELIWRNAVCLAAITVVSLILAYIMLRRIRISP